MGKPMRAMFHWKFIAAALLSTSLMFGLACGGNEPSNTPEPTATNPPQEEPTATATPTEEPTEEGEPTPTATTDAPAPTATPETATATPPPSGQTLAEGTINVADVSIPAPTFRNAFLDWPANLKIRQWGFTDPLMDPDPSVEPPDRGDPVAGIATSWEVASDRSTVTFQIRDDIEFHKGWGPLTAEDVAYSLNDVHSEGSTYARRGELEQWVDEWEATDSDTVVLHTREPDNPLPADWWQALTWSNAPTIFSKAVFDDKGEGEARQTMVGTGPFEVQSWTQNEEINAEAVENHWRQTPKMSNLKIVEIPEASTRIAAWKTGSVDIAFIPLAFLNDALESVDGSWTSTISPPRGQHVAFAGNYWIQEPHDPDIVPEEEVFPRPGLDKSLPWVGDPRDDESMEQARKVRRALAMAIDRETISEGVLKGFAEPMHAWLFPDDSEYFKEEWTIPFDPEGAQELLAEAGFPDGFEMPYNVPPDSPVINPQVGQAIAQMWRNIGIDVQLKSPAYAANRPSLVDRSNNTPWLMHSKTFQAPPDEAHGMAVLATRGFSFGMELQKVSDTFLENQEEQDREQRIQNNVELEDWLHEWMPWAPAVKQFEVWAVRPEVKEWEPLGDDENIANRFETVVIER